MFLHVVKWTLIIILTITIILCLIGALVVAIRILRHRFRYTKMYAWIVHNDGLSLTTKEKERFEQIEREKAGGRDLNKDCLKIEGEWYAYSPDIIGDGPGSFVNVNDWVEYNKGRKYVDEVRVYDLKPHKEG